MSIKMVEFSRVCFSDLLREWDSMAEKVPLDCQGRDCESFPGPQKFCRIVIIDIQWG